MGASRTHETPERRPVVALKTFTVLVRWRDGDVEDADEIVVRSLSGIVAKRTASAVWTAMNSIKYPKAEIVEVEILTSRMRRSFA